MMVKTSIFGPKSLVQEMSDLLADRREPEPDLVPIARERSPEPTLPDTHLTAFAKALAHVVQAPTSLAMNALLGSLASVVQAHADVMIPVNGGYRVPISLYLLSVAQSGDRKSACDALATKGIRDHQAEQIDGWEDARVAYEMTQEAWELQRKEILREHKEDPETLQAEIAAHAAAKPVAPRSPIAITNNATPEGLFKELLHGQRSMILSTDEGGAFFGGYSMADAQRKRAATAFYNEAWGAKQINSLRKGDGAVILRGYRLSMHLLIQPSVIEEAWKDEDLQGNGFWGRFLVACPESLWGTREIAPRHYDAQEREKLQRSLQILQIWQDLTKKIAQQPQPLSENGKALDPKVLEMTEKAVDAWIAFADECERKGGIFGEYAEIRGLSNKAAEHAARLAANFHVLMNEGKAEQFDKIGQEEMEQAILLIRWYLQSAVRMMQAPVTSEDRKLQEVYDTMLRRADRLEYDEFTPSDLVRACGKINNVKAAKAVLESLRQNGAVVAVGEATIDGKKRVDVWRLLRND